jgi:hypothetical protein
LHAGEQSGQGVHKGAGAAAEGEDADMETDTGEETPEEHAQGEESPPRETLPRGGFGDVV